MIAYKCGQDVEIHTLHKKGKNMQKFIDQIRDITVPKKYEQYIGSIVAGDPVKTVELVAIEDIQLPEVQRDFSLANIYKNIERKGGLDYNLFGVPTIRRKPSTGALDAANGQHRIIKQILFNPTETHIMCEVIDIEDDAKAAEYFADVNALAIRKLDSQEIFWAQVLAGDKTALFHKSILELADVSIGKVNRAVGRKHLKYANFLKAINHSVDGTVYAIDLLRTAYPKREIKNVTMASLALIFSLPEYKSLMDPNTKIGALFKEWFMSVSKHGYDTFDYTQYRDANQWHYGIAFGIYRNFAKYARDEMNGVPSVKPIKDLYELKGGSNG